MAKVKSLLYVLPAAPVFIFVCLHLCVYTHTHTDTYIAHTKHSIWNTQGRKVLKKVFIVMCMQRWLRCHAITIHYYNRIQINTHNKKQTHTTPQQENPFIVPWSLMRKIKNKAVTSSYVSPLYTKKRFFLFTSSQSITSYPFFFGSGCVRMYVKECKS